MGLIPFPKNWNRILRPAIDNLIFKTNLDPFWKQEKKVSFEKVNCRSDEIFPDVSICCLALLSQTREWEFWVSIWNWIWTKSSRSSTVLKWIPSIVNWSHCFVKGDQIIHDRVVLFLNLRTIYQNNSCIMLTLAVYFACCALLTFQIRFCISGLLNIAEMIWLNSFLNKN